MPTLTYSASYPPTMAKELLRHRGTCTSCMLYNDELDELKPFNLEYYPVTA